MSEKLLVLWTSGDRETAKNMVFMYTLNAKKKGWFDEVTLVIWGASDTLLAGDEELQGILKEMIELGVKVEACLRCAENLGVEGKLRELGVEVKLMGRPLTDYLKEGRRVLSV
jgi:hypothetical protein